MPQPTQSDVHVNAPLTNISIAYMQDQNEFVADKVFPNVPVAKQSDVYYTYPKGAWFRTDAQKRGLAQESAGSGFAVSTDSYRAEVQALHKDIDDQVRANADNPINVERDATEFVTRDLMLRRELDWGAKYFTTSVWTGSTTGGDITPGTLWSAASSTPIKDIRTQMGAIKSKTGFRPNTLVLGEDVWNQIQDNADFLARVNVSSSQIVTIDLLRVVLGLDKVLIGGGVNNTALEGATDDLDWIFQKDALLCYAAPRPSLMMPSAGYTFSWTGYLGATTSGTRMSRFRMEHLRSDRVEGEIAYDIKLVAAELGAFFSNCIA